MLSEEIVEKFESINKISAETLLKILSGEIPQIYVLIYEKLQNSLSRFYSKRKENIGDFGKVIIWAYKWDEKAKEYRHNNGEKYHRIIIKDLLNSIDGVGNEFIYFESMEEAKLFAEVGT